MTEIVAVDLGGTHARFAIATVAEGRVTTLGAETTLRTADHASFERAWGAYAAAIGRPLPRHAAIAVAAPVQGDVLRFTNNPWTIRPDALAAQLAVDTHILINDFAAVAHAVAQVEAEHLRHLAGPARALREDEMISVVGPGTGLGVAAVLRRHGAYSVIPAEGGHTDFAPLDGVEDAILQLLRARHRRVSVERVVSGPGLEVIHEALARLEGEPMAPRDNRALWTAALSGADTLAAAALDRFCLALGAAAGDVVLAQGGTALVIAGGLGLRLADRLPRSGFAERFMAKGRFEGMMATIPVKLITHPQPGLYGAAAAYAQEHAR